MKKIITIEWEIHDTRNLNGGFKTGVSKLEVKAKGYEEIINAAINFADNLPSWELEKNGINLEEYKEGKICRYYYATKLSKILKIENAKQGEERDENLQN